MWFYPIPSLIAAVGWVFVLATADRFALLLSLGVALSGLCVYSYSGMGARSYP
jgi:hypothetical protein